MSRRRKTSLTRRTRLAYRQSELAHVLTLPEKEFGGEFGMRTTEIEREPSPYRRFRDPENYYHFRDNSASVLAVAHLDTVVTAERREPRFSNSQQAGPVVVSGALDDRLGAYVILKLLPKLGITCDWLLTVGEESGMSTAEYFNPEGKEYDWIIEFDRAGTDVVMYDYEDRASRLAVQASGARVGKGSFSDICYLEHLNIKGFNWGVGYDGNYHSEHGYAYLNDTFTMVAKYLRFHAQNAGTAMPHTPDWPVYRQAHWWDTEADTGRQRETSGFIDCDSCGALQAVDPDTLICAYCDTCLNCQEEALVCTCPGGPGVWTVNAGSTLATRN